MALAETPAVQAALISHSPVYLYAHLEDLKAHGSQNITVCHVSKSNCKVACDFIHSEVEHADGLFLFKTFHRGHDFYDWAVSQIKN